MPDIAAAAARATARGAARDEPLPRMFMLPRGARRVTNALDAAAYFDAAALRVRALSVDARRAARRAVLHHVILISERSLLLSCFSCLLPLRAPCR